MLVGIFGFERFSTLKCTFTPQADRERKRQEELERKQAAKLLLAEEESQIGGKSKGTGTSAKMTRAQISEAKAELSRESGATASALPCGVTEIPVVEENPNRLLQQQQLKGEIDARTVDEAIAVLSVSKEEKHPEKRLKAAYAAFEERELPRLKAEFPNLRLSQLKQMLRKDWMKSPENPLNQHFASYNEKT